VDSGPMDGIGLVRPKSLIGLHLHVGVVALDRVIDLWNVRTRSAGGCAYSSRSCSEYRRSISKVFPENWVLVRKKRPRPSSNPA